MSSTTEEIAVQPQQQHQEEHQQHDDTQESHKKLEGEELLEAIRKQVEYYLSRQNLNNDPFLVSHMDKDLFVPIEIIANFKMMKTLTDEATMIVQAVRSSTSVMLDETGTKLRPNFTISRNTVILRDIPSSTSEEEVKKLFAADNQPVSVRSDIGDTWFVTFDTDEQALQSLDFIRNKTLNDKPIKARIKSENLLKSFNQFQGNFPQQQYPRQNYPPRTQNYNQYPQPQFGERRGRGGPRRGGPRRGGRDYYNPKPSNSAKIPNGNVPMTNSGSRQPQHKGHNNTNMQNVQAQQQHQQQPQTSQSSQQQQMPHNKPRSRSDAKNIPHQQPQSRERSKSFNNKKQRQAPQPAPVIDNTKNFPPLPSISQTDRSKSGYGLDEFIKYPKQTVVDVFAHIVKDLKKPTDLPTDCVAVVDTPYTEMELMKPLTGVPTEVTQQPESVDVDTMISFAEAAVTARDIKTPEITTEHLLPRRRRGSSAGKDQLSGRKRSDSNASTSSTMSARSDKSTPRSNNTPQSPAHIHRPEPIKPKFDKGKQQQQHQQQQKKTEAQPQKEATSTETTQPSTTSYASILQAQE